MKKLLPLWQFCENENSTKHILPIANFSFASVALCFLQQKQDGCAT